MGFFNDLFKRTKIDRIRKRKIDSNAESTPKTYIQPIEQKHALFPRLLIQNHPMFQRCADANIALWNIPLLDCLRLIMILDRNGQQHYVKEQNFTKFNMTKSELLQQLFDNFEQQFVNMGYRIEAFESDRKCSAMYRLHSNSPYLSAMLLNDTLWDEQMKKLGIKSMLVGMPIDNSMYFADAKDDASVDTLMMHYELWRLNNKHDYSYDIPMFKRGIGQNFSLHKIKGWRVV